MTAGEVTIAAAAVLLDLALPILVLLLLAVVSLAIRQKGFGSLGFHRPTDPWHLVAKMGLFACGWTLVNLSVVMPIVNHVSGKRQDFSDFEDLHGDLAMLTRVARPQLDAGRRRRRARLLGLPPDPDHRPRRFHRARAHGRGRRVVAAVRPAHTEQGAVGVALTTVDAVVFSVLRYRYKTLWAAVLAHGFNNTIGFIAFFLVGPLYGFW